MPPREAKDFRSRALLIVLLLLYLLGRMFQLWPDRIPNLLIVVLHVIPPALFAVIHGSRIYRWRGMIVFVLLCIGMGAFFEALSLRSGFPFGHYVFTDLMGPKLFGLPVLLALAYVGMGYLSWIVALVILGYRYRPIAGSGMVRVPLVASLVMVAWDFSMDPIWANIDRAWIWRDGGAYFGVPISNFLGWLLTVLVIYQLFALYLRNRPVAPMQEAEWRWPIMFYAASAAGNLLIAIPASMPKLIMDASGRGWMVSHILWASRLVSVFVMLPFALIALAALVTRDASYR
jgi:putative membrane protein